MKKLRLIIGSLAAVFLVQGCSPVGSDLLSFSTDVPLSTLQQSLAVHLPVKRKMGFGTVRISAAKLETVPKAKGMGVLARITLTTFEIPEGIDGTVAMRGTLRYDPNDRSIYLSDLHSMGLKFDSRSLAEYVTPEAQKNLPSVVAGELGMIPLYTLRKKRSVKKIVIEPEKIVLKHGL